MGFYVCVSCVFPFVWPGLVPKCSLLASNRISRIGRRPVERQRKAVYSQHDPLDPLSPRYSSPLPKIPRRTDRQRSCRSFRSSTRCCLLLDPTRPSSSTSPAGRKAVLDQFGRGQRSRTARLGRSLDSHQTATNPKLRCIMCNMNSPSGCPTLVVCRRLWECTPVARLAVDRSCS